MSEDGRDLDLLVIGELNPDVIVLGAPERPAFGQAETLVDAISLTVGSSSAIMACGAARLGLRVGFAGIVGDDDLGRFMLRALADRGVDVGACLVDATRPTGASVILGRGERPGHPDRGRRDRGPARDRCARVAVRTRPACARREPVPPDGPPTRPGGAADRGASSGRHGLDRPELGPDRQMGADRRRACRRRRLPAQCRRSPSTHGPARSGVGRRIAGRTGSRRTCRGREARRRRRTGRRPRRCRSPGRATHRCRGHDRGGRQLRCRVHRRLVGRLDDGRSASTSPIACGSASTRRPGGVDGQPTFEEAAALVATAGRFPATVAGARSLTVRLLCIAPNPSIDRLVEVDRLVPGTIHRPTLVRAVAGGKGLNVARAAASLGATVTAVGILAGHGGRWLAEALDADGVDRPVRLDGRRDSGLHLHRGRRHGPAHRGL